MSETTPGNTADKAGRDDPSKIDWSLFGPTIRYAAAACRVRPELLMTYLASVLGGLSGVFSRVRGPMNELRHPSVPLTLAVDFPTRADSIARIALEPAIWRQESNRRYSQFLFPDKLAEHVERSHSPIDEAHLKYLEMLEPGGTLHQEWDIKAVQADLLRHRQHSQPSFLIVSPRPETFDDLRGEVFDEFPLVFDPTGDSVLRALDGTKASQPWRDLLERIATGATAGIDQKRGPGGLATLHQSVCSRTPFLAHLPGDLVCRALQTAASRKFLQAGLILPTARIGSRLEFSHRTEGLKSIERIRNAVHCVIDRRFAGDETWLRCIEAGEEFALGVERFQDRLDTVPPELRPYTGALVGLPQRLLWAAQLLDRQETHPISRMAGSALQGANWCLDEHLKLIRSSLNQARRQRLIKEAIEMVEKLEGLREKPPCTFRKLARCYSDQRRKAHEPTLSFLSDEGVVEWDGRCIALLEPDPLPDWLQGRAFVNRN